MSDYDTIDKGIIMAYDMDDRKVFEDLLEGCEIGWTIEGGYEHSVFEEEKGQYLMVG